MRPALTPILADRLPLIEHVPPLSLGPPSPEDEAAWMAFGAAVDGYDAPDASITDTAAPGPHGDVPVRVYRPLGGPATHGLVWGQVEVERVVGVPHGHLNTAGLPEALMSIDGIARFVTAVEHGPASSGART